jgi:hypothetical protein
VSFIVDVKKHHRCVPKDNEFRCLGNGRSIKLGVGLSGTIASHKKLTLVVSITIFGRCLWINRNVLHHFSFYLYTGSVQISNFAT